MGNPSFGFTLDDKKINYAIVTGKGVQNKDKIGTDKEMEYVVAVACTPKEKKAIIKQINAFYEENVSTKWAKDNDNNKDPDSFFTEDKESKGDFLFWASQAVVDGIKYKRAEGTDFDGDTFASLGSGSKADVEYRCFFFIHNGKEGVGLRLSAVKLNEYVKYTGGGGNMLSGEEVDIGAANGTTVSEGGKPETDYAEVVSEFEEALADKDYKLAKTLLGDMDGFEDQKKYKKILKKAKSGK